MRHRCFVPHVPMVGACHAQLWCLPVQVVAAAAGSANARMALFAQINSASAVVIAALQLAATGRLLARMGLAPALAASPAITAMLMAAIALAPSPFTVASGEVLRKARCAAHCRPSPAACLPATSLDSRL